VSRPSSNRTAGSPPLTSRPWLVEGLLLGLAAAAMALILGFVDLSPRVESDFFFSTDDPQLRTSRQIEERFPASPQLVLRAVVPEEEGDGAGAGGGEGQGQGQGQGQGVLSASYRESIAALTEALARVDGVTAVQSLTRGPSSREAAAGSPFWSRLLLSEDGKATHLVVSLDPAADPGAVVRGVEAAVASSKLGVDLSGVPYVVELIRRYLSRDLRVFSAAALLVFGLLIGGLFRSARIMLGTLTACLTACALTLGLLGATGFSIGILTANLVTIVFVLTLSHAVFLTTNWQRLASREEGGEGPGGAGAGSVVPRAVRLTFGASFWCMATTLLGFLSLLTASARPLRELGSAGAVGTAVAIAVAYTFYPPFLRHARPPRRRERSESGTARPLSLPIALGIIAVALAVGSGLVRLSADPSLLSYFRAESELRRGLAAIDADGGSSPLSVLVVDPDGGRLDTPAAMKRLDALQAALEADPDTGVVLSVSPLLAEAKRSNPLAAFLPPQMLLDILEQPGYQRVALAFMSADRSTAHFFLRMRETGRTGERGEIIDRLGEKVRGAGLTPELIGGLYELQGRLASLVARSLLRGLAGLLLLFLAIGAWVSRSARSTGAMVASLVLVPLFLLGVMGALAMPIDFISSPAAQIAIAIGVDSMIHLATAARRARQEGLGLSAAWRRARSEMAPAVLAASLIVAVGFGLFALSSFPPTQRFGFAIALGTAASAAVTLLVLPVLAARSR